MSPIIRITPCRLPISRVVVGTVLLCLAGCAADELPAPEVPPTVALKPEPPPPAPPRRPLHPPPRPKPPAPEVTADDASPAERPEEHIDLVGLDASRLVEKLGEPETQTDSPPATIWHYSAVDCAVDLYLYRDLQTGALKALFVEMKGDDQSDQRRQSCYRQLGSNAERRRSDASVAR
ncbi:MAG TPA: hypothetical protein VNT30_12825 [Stellaceae bacterium]|nr:hypothetical protein [Stellaceae bacterium]